MKLFVNDLTVIDSTFLCPDRGLVGESWIVDIELGGQLNDMNMVLDFGLVKKTIKRTIDDTVDHRLLVPNRSPMCKLTPIGSDLKLDFWRPEGRSVHLCCPQQAYALLDCVEVTETALIDYMRQKLVLVLPTNITDLTIRLRNEAIDGPYYHYTHGLKKHDGNCQRIAHGHRSTIEIYVDDEPAPELAASWAMKWRNIYLASQSDCVGADALRFCDGLDLSKHVTSCYTSPQGTFELAVPSAECDILPCDTTVENLATLIATTLSGSMPGHSIRVHAFEGVGKGAIATIVSPT
jgi:6-pyruvoyl-tetrahydropterin synthase